MRDSVATIFGMHNLPQWGGKWKGGEWILVKHYLKTSHAFYTVCGSEVWVDMQQWLLDYCIRLGALKLGLDGEPVQVFIEGLLLWKSPSRVIEASQDKGKTR
jgi:hypothetical protein